jgi:hypothetical protein
MLGVGLVWRFDGNRPHGKLCCFCLADYPLEALEVEGPKKTTCYC